MQKKILIAWGCLMPLWSNVPPRYLYVLLCYMLKCGMYALVVIPWECEVSFNDKCSQVWENVTTLKMKLA